VKQAIRICLVLSLLNAALFSLPATSFPAPTLQHWWYMNTNPGWTTQGQWAYGKPMGGGGENGYHDPVSGHTGSNVYGYNLYGDYDNDLPEYHLTSKPIDCTGLSQVTLKFWRWLGVEEADWDQTQDHAYIRVSNNGSTWTTVWENPERSDIADDSWVQQELDISVYADDQLTVYLRWTMGTTDSTVRYCGWNIDDVEIWGVACPPCPANGIIKYVTYPEDAECSCTNATSITIGPGVTVENGATVTFQAPTVKLQPGFHAENGAVVRIRQPQ